MSGKPVFKKLSNWNYTVVLFTIREFCIWWNSLYHVLRRLLNWKGNLELASTKIRATKLRADSSLHYQCVGKASCGTSSTAIGYRPLSLPTHASKFHDALKCWLSLTSEFNGQLYHGFTNIGTCHHLNAISKIQFSTISTTLILLRRCDRKRRYVYLSKNGAGLNIFFK